MTDARWDRALLLMALNVPVIVYPVILQRYNRVRLASLMERMETRVSGHHRY